MKIIAAWFVTALLGGCALFTGEPGQQQAAAVLISCEPLQNGGRMPGPGCEQEAAEQYRQYSNDLKDARAP